MSQIHFTINGIPCVCEEGMSILQAAKANGIEIPNLCNDESVRVYGACGLCAVLPVIFSPSVPFFFRTSRST